MIRAVVDPGVLIAGLITPTGATSELIRSWRDGRFDMIVSPHLLEELTDVLLRPKFRNWASERDAVLFVETIRLAAIGHPDPEHVPSVSADPKDDYLLALAIAAHADVIVSGDRDLLSLSDHRPPVVAPRAFADALA